MPSVSIFALMNKRGFIRYWKTTAAMDWKRVNLLFKNRDYVYALFLAHLTLEKLVKGHWVKDNKANYPPKIHNLNKIIAQTKLDLSEDEKNFCADMNKFQIEGHYPDYVSNIYKIINKPYATSYLTLCDKLRKKLLAQLP